MAISINGYEDDHNSAIIKIGTRQFLGFKSIDYTSELKPGAVRGTSARKRGRTIGNAEYTASGEMYLREFEELTDELFRMAPAVGYGMVPFLIMVAYAPPGQRVINAELRECRIIKDSMSSSEGEAALTVQFDLDVMDIIRNGKSIFKLS